MHSSSPQGVRLRTGTPRSGLDLAIDPRADLDLFGVGDEAAAGPETYGEKHDEALRHPVQRLVPFDTHTEGSRAACLGVKARRRRYTPRP
jgi:hypothetical protein